MGNYTDGKFLFAELMFAGKELGESIPEIQRIRELGNLDKLNQSQAIFLDTLKNNLIKIIEKQDPLFFTSFSNKIHSGNPFEVQNAMNIAGDKILIALAMSNPSFSPLLKIGFNPEFNDSLQNSSNDFLAQLDTTESGDLDLRKIKFNDKTMLDLQVDRLTDIDKVLALNKDLNSYKDLQLNNDHFLNLSLAKIKDINVGSAVWKENDFVVVGEVAIVAVAVIAVVIERRNLEDRSIFQEKLISSITEKYATQ
jgi:hypothetical protein